MLFRPAEKQTFLPPIESCSLLHTCLSNVYFVKSTDVTKMWIISSLPAEHAYGSSSSSEWHTRDPYAYFVKTPQVNAGDSHSKFILYIPYLRTRLQEAPSAIPTSPSQIEIIRWWLRIVQISKSICDISMSETRSLFRMHISTPVFFSIFFRTNTNHPN